MQIIINPDQTTTKVWELIELQGTLQFTQSHVNEFGVLDLSNDVPTLKIGPTILEGKSVKLQKPFALIEKDEVKHEWNVKGLIKQKYVFDQRPHTMGSFQM